AERFAEAPLGLADVPVVERAGVEPEERAFPGGGDRLGAETLPGALHAQEEHAARRGDAELHRFRLERAGALEEPALEPVEPADLVERRGRVDELEQAVGLEDAALL